jgi:hypothetical protein
LAPSCTKPAWHVPFSGPCLGHFPPTLSVGSHCNPPYPYLSLYIPVSVSTFHSSYTSTLKMEAAQSKTLESNHHTVWCNNPEKQEFCLHCHENLKSQHVVVIYIFKK